MSNGVEVVEAFYGERLTRELIPLIARTPDDQLRALADNISEAAGQLELGGWIEEPLQAALPESGRLIGPEALLFPHSTPLSVREGIDQYVLLCERLVVADPVLAWAQPGRFLSRWGSPDAGDRQGSDLSRGQVLANRLAGLLPFLDLIASGEVVLARPPIEPDLEMNRLWVNPTTRAQLPTIFPGWGFSEDGSYSFDRLHAELDYYAGGPQYVWGDVANHFFGEGPEALAKLARAVGLDDYAANNGIAPIPSSSVESFFQMAKANGGRGLELLIPRLSLTVGDAIRLRRDSEIFSDFRSVLADVLVEAQAFASVSSAEAYAEAVRDIGASRFEELEARLQTVARRGWLASVLIPGAVKLAFGVGMRWSPVPVPGVGPAAGLIAKKSLASHAVSYETSQLALAFVSNLRLVGRV